MDKLVVSYYKGETPYKEEFSNIDEALEVHNKLEEDKEVKYADLDVVTTTKLKGFRRQKGVYSVC